MTTKSLTLDIWQKNNVIVKANQGEVNSRFLQIKILDKNNTFSLAGKIVIFYATKPDGNVIYNYCLVEDAENGVVSVCLTSQMSSECGKMFCEIHIIDEKASTLKVLGLEIYVLPCKNLDQAIESKSEFTALQEAMSGYNHMSKNLEDHMESTENPHKVTTEQIGAVPSFRTINSKPLISDIELSCADIGAATENHNHNFNSITEKPTSLEGYGIADAVPVSRTINGENLSQNISLTANDLGAATIVKFTTNISTNWVDGGNGSYLQTVDIAGILATDTPIVDLILSDVLEDSKAQIAAWNCISRIKTADGSITLYCFEEKPTVAINVQLLCVR